MAFFSSITPCIAEVFLCRAELVRIRKQTELPGGFSVASAHWKLRLQGEEPELDQMTRANAKIPCMFRICCCCCPGGVARVSDRHWWESTPLWQYFKYWVFCPRSHRMPESGEPLLPARRGKGWYFQLTQPCKRERASGPVSVKLSKTLLVAAPLLAAFRRVLLCRKKK